MPACQPTGIYVGAGIGLQADDVVTLTTAQWDAVIEGGISSTGLTQGSWYYCGCDGGKITTGVPVPGGTLGEQTTSSPVGAKLGFALSPTQLYLSIGDPPNTINLPNNGATLGMPVLIDLPADTTVFTPGGANSINAAQVSGIVAYSNAADSSLVAFTSGMELEFTVAQWNARTGGSGGLSPGGTYYLGTTLGSITGTAPTGSGVQSVKIGSAVSTTKLAIQIGPPVPSPVT